MLQDNPAFQPDPFCDPSFIHIHGYPVQSFHEVQGKWDQFGVSTRATVRGSFRRPPYEMGETFVCQPQTSLALLLKSSGDGQEEGKCLCCRERGSRLGLGMERSEHVGQTAGIGWGMAMGCPSIPLR